MVEGAQEALQDALMHAEKAQCILSTLVDIDRVCAAEDSRGCADDLVQSIEYAIVFFDHYVHPHNVIQWPEPPYMIEASSAYHDQLGG